MVKSRLCSVDLETKLCVHSTCDPVIDMASRDICTVSCLLLVHALPHLETVCFMVCVSTACHCISCDLVLMFLTTVRLIADSHLKANASEYGAAIVQISVWRISSDFKFVGIIWKHVRCLKTLAPCMSFAVLRFRSHELYGMKLTG